MTHLLIGSVAERVVRAAPCPVLTVRHAPAAHTPEAIMFTRILVPMDFSPQSDTALEYARILAARFGASMHLLHIVEDPFVTGPLGSDMYMPPPSDTITARLKDAQEKLAHHVRASAPAGVRATSEVLSGSVARTIVDYAAENGYHLIVMGTHGRTGIAHLVMGSVAESVLRTAPCPVLTVRHPRVPATMPIGVEGVSATA